jgi:hypothetical protein
LRNNWRAQLPNEKAPPQRRGFPDPSPRLAVLLATLLAALLLTTLLLLARLLLSTLLAALLTTLLLLARFLLSAALLLTTLLLLARLLVRVLIHLFLSNIGLKRHSITRPLATFNAQWVATVPYANVCEARPNVSGT